jgi:MFS family permease
MATDGRGSVPPLELRLKDWWHARPRPSLLLFCAVCAVVGLATLTCQLLGLRHVTIFVALVALYIAMGSFGGTLRADLRIVRTYFVALLLFVAAPLLLARWSPTAGALLFVAVIGVCGIIAALGDRYDPVRLGIGLLTVYSFGYQTTRGTDSIDVIKGAFAALAIILAIRLVAAIPDADGPLRQSIGRVLLDTSREAVRAAASRWLDGPSSRWTGSSLIGAVQYRAATWIVNGQLDRLQGGRAQPVREMLSRLDASAAALATVVRSRRPDATAATAILAQIKKAGADSSLDDPLMGPPLRVAVAALSHVADSASTRDERIVEEAHAIRRASAIGALRAALSLDSDYFRMALRAMVTVAAALLVVHALKQATFALPLLMGAYGVLQPTFTLSLREARRRTVGVAIGALLAIVIVSVVPTEASAFVSALALAAAFAYISSSIAIFMGGLVASLTISLAPLLHVDPAMYAVGYAVAVVVGAALATTVGHLTIPVQTRVRRQRTLTTAMTSTGLVLAMVGRASVTDQRRQLLTAFRDLQNTKGAHSGEAPGLFQRAAVALESLNLLALALALGIAPRTPSVDETLAAIVRGLNGGARDRLELQQRPSSAPLLEGLEQLVLAEYHELHTAMSAIQSQ